MNSRHAPVVLAALLAWLGTAASAQADADKWVQETGDLMSGSLGINTSSGFALFTYPGDSVDVGGDIYKEGHLFLHGRAAYGTTGLGFGSGPPPTSSALYSTAIGSGAMANATTGFGEIAVGINALRSLSGGVGYNIAVGWRALESSTSGDHNIGVGKWALKINTTGAGNVGVGSYTLSTNGTGSLNAAFGQGAMVYAFNTQRNTAVGAFALAGEDPEGMTGDGNIAIGFQAGNAVRTGSDNILIGHVGDASEEATIRIGTPDLHNDTFIAGISGVPVSGVNVVIDVDGKLGTTVSSRRFKEDIAGLGEESARLMALRPVSFRYKSEFAHGGERPLEFGLIAEEVAEVMPELVVYDEEGRPGTVRYQHLIPLLLNELQEQQRAIARLSSQVAEQAEVLENR